MRMGRVLWVLLAAALMLVRPVVAAEWVDNESGRIGLVAATTATGQAATIEAGLAFQLKPGWHIYWRTPGDAGYPPRIDWSGSDNIGQPSISWPAPTRFVLAGLQNYGYFGQVVLPISAPLAHPGKPAKLAALVDYLACDKLCVPLQARLEVTLPAGPAAPTASFHDIGRFKALVPGNGAGGMLAVVGAEALGAEALRLTVTAAEPLIHPDVFIEAPDIANFDPPKLLLSEGGRRALLTLPVVPGTRQAPLAGARLRVTLVDGDRALETVVTPVPAAAPPEPPRLSLLAMIGVALLGGLILNLMPCVLPVLSIKVLGAIGHGGAERGHVRASFLCSAIGIQASFMALAGAAIAIKRAGQAVGWGIQFQQPVFLAAMVAVLTLFAANLWGAFEIALPSWLINSGSGRTKHHSLLGHFLSGAFATLLATPCSAPFVGTAIGFALARGPLEIVAIFAALGIGMGAPFLLVAIRPEAAIRLPKPGKWMVTVKKALGLVLVATALWLLSVLAAQAGWLPAAVVGGAMVAAALMLTLRHRLPENSRSAAAVAAAALAAAAVVVPLQSGYGERATASTEAKTSGIVWIPFSPTALAAAVDSGHTVFVDVTADWCITCKVNKAAVVERGEVARRLTSGRVVAMRADWTRPDDVITQYLASFGRYGVPFNAVYGPAAKDGLPLSELLNEADVLTALDRAGGK